MRNKKAVSISLALGAVCVLIIGLWAAQAPGSQMAPIGSQQQVAAAPVNSDAGAGGATSAQPSRSSMGGPDRGARNDEDARGR